MDTIKSLWRGVARILCIAMALCVAASFFGAAAHAAGNQETVESAGAASVAESAPQPTSTQQPGESDESALPGPADDSLPPEDEASEDAPETQPEEPVSSGAVAPEDTAPKSEANSGAAAQGSQPLKKGAASARAAIAPLIAATTQAELQAALASMDPAITINSDFTIATTLTIPAGYTGIIDLNGHTVTLGGGIAVQVGADITFIDTGATKGKFIRGAAYTGVLLNVNGSATVQAVFDGNRMATASNIVNVQNGGALTLVDGGVLQNNIRNNVAGGGVYVYAGGVFDMTGGLIQNCEALRSGSTKGGNGGGVLVNGTFNMTGGTIQNCRAIASGGGVGVNAGTTTTALFTMQAADPASPPVITGNRATNGGGVWNSSVQNSSILIVSGTISNNVATSSGGGIQNNSYSSTSIQYDGASYNCGVLVAGGTISGNSAGTYSSGGGLHNESTSSAHANAYVVVLGGTFTANTASSGAGIYLAQRASVTQPNIVKNATITGNTASSGGGGLYITSGETQVENITVTGNGARNGAGLYVGSTRTVTLTNATIDGNEASAAGGGVYLSGGATNVHTITGGAITNNTATTDGGGLYLNSGAATLSGTAVANNEATQNGGGLFIRAGTATLQNGAAIHENTATLAGGGVYANGTGNTNRAVFTMEGGAAVYLNTAEQMGDDVSTAANGYGSITLLPVASMTLPPTLNVNGWYHDVEADRFKTTDVANPYTILGADTAENHLTLGAAWAVTYTDGAGQSVFADVVYANIPGGRPTPAFNNTDPTVQPPARPGYVFAGWSPAVDATVTRDIDYVAVWQPVVTYGANYAGSTQPNIEDTATGTPPTHTVRGTTTFTRPGYTLAGWNTAPDGTGTSYTHGQVVALEAPLTLYAVWVPAGSSSSSSTPSSSQSTPSSSLGGGGGTSRASSAHSSAVNTGDGMHLALWMALAAAGFVSAVALIAYSRKNKNEQNKRQ